MMLTKGDNQSKVQESWVGAVPDRRAHFITILCQIHNIFSVYSYMLFKMNNCFLTNYATPIPQFCMFMG